MSNERPPEIILREIFAAAVEHASPDACLPAALPASPPGQTIVVGAGKAAAAMARVVEAHCNAPLRGCVVTAYGHGQPCRAITVLEAGHPSPDEASVQAARQVLAQVDGLGPQDLVLCLLSGGGSALLALPAAGITLANKQDVSRQLLRSGANIHEINCVRKHLSAIKGGRLAAACSPATVVTLAISDVDDDDPAVIASGPTVANTTTAEEAQQVLDRYGITTPAAVRRHLASASAATVKPGDARLDRNVYKVIASPATALRAAATAAESMGLQARSLGLLNGEARMLGARHARLAREVARELRPGDRPVVLLSGGETTVTVKGSGHGGRNSEYALALAIGLQGNDQVFALAADTDGIDGSGTNAGCIVYPDSLQRARQAGIDPAAALLNNDSGGFFASLDNLLVTGPTRTNVNDFRALYIRPPAS